MNKTILVAILSLVQFVIFAQGRFDDVEIVIHKLTDEAYMLEGAGGNIGLYVSQDHTFMIDDQYAPLSDRLVAAIGTLTKQSVTQLVNTHWHGDHSGGNENFGNAGAMIIAHDNVYERMSTEQVRGERITPASPEIALPVMTYNDKMTIYSMGEPIMVMHIHNAHTDGDSFVWLPESNVLHMGDVFFNKRFPYIDLDSGGSIDGMIHGVETALVLVNNETQIIPGHGPMADQEDLKIYLNVLHTLRSRVQESISEKIPLEEIKAEKITEGFEDLNWQFIDSERITTIIYNSLVSNTN